MATQLKLFVFIIGLKTSSFPVTIETSQTVGDLKESIFEKKKNRLKGVEADELTLYHVELPDDNILGQSAALAVEQKELLPPPTPLDQIFPTKPPVNRINIVVHVDNINNTALAMNDALVHSDLIREYGAFFIKVGRWRRFEHADIRRNDIYDTSGNAAPNFVTEFEHTLDGKPGLDPNDGTWAQVNISDPSWGATYLSSEEGNPGRYVGEGEVKHLSILSQTFNWQNLWQESENRRLKGGLATYLFFLPFLPQLQPALTNSATTVRIDQGMPFPFITQREDIQDPKEQLRMYNPRSDFLISRFKLPRLLVEINSTNVDIWPKDLIRLLLQGAAIVRFANTFLEAFRDAKNFVLCAVFIWGNGHTTRHTLFQQQEQEQGSRTVYYRTKGLSLNTSVDRIDFARQLYNLIHNRLEGENGTDTQTKAERLDRVINAHQLKSFNTKDATNTADKSTDTGGANKRARTDDGGGAGGWHERAADHEELRAHGYEVETGVVVDDRGVPWEPVYETPSHIHTVYRPSDPMNKLIAKKIRRASNELEIFKLLDSAQPKSDHVITLVDSFQGQSRKWAILPKMESVADCIKFAPKELESNVVQVCLGLVKGLGYLHKLCIAHRDIKPSNLLVDRDFRLKVIDFDIAMRVQDEDEEVDGQCGTEGWIAPEVEKSVMYSPIRADRWSCGHVLLYLLDIFRKDDRPLRAIAGELHSDDPRQRPSLVKSCSTLSQPLSDVGDIRPTDGRKSSRSREVSMEIEGENKIPLNAKKQKLDVLGLGQDEKSERHDYSRYLEVTPVY